MDHDVVGLNVTPVVGGNIVIPDLCHAMETIDLLRAEQLSPGHAQ